MKLTDQHVAALQAILDGRISDAGVLLCMMPVEEVHELGRACSGLASGCKGVENIYNGTIKPPQRSGQ